MKPFRTATSVLAAGALVAAPLLFAAPAQAATACTAKQLSGKVGKSDGAAGTIYNTFVLTNVSGAACTIKGAPGITRYANDGRAQSTKVVNDIKPGAKKVTLAPGAKASFVWAYSDVPSGDASSCPNTRVMGVSMPGSSSKRLYMAVKVPYCSKDLRVSAVAGGVLPPG